MIDRWVTMLMLAVAVGSWGCSSASQPAPKPPMPPQQATLRVGMGTQSPPYAFIQGGRLVGIEVDLAAQLAHDMGRKLEVVEMPFGELIPALLARKVDIVMSGLSSTPTRRIRVDFSDPYFRPGLMAAVRTGDKGTYKTVDDISGGSAAIGVVSDTTAERVVRERVPNGIINAYPAARYAASELKEGRIDVYVGDAPVVLWMVSENESDLVVVREGRDVQELAWAVRPGERDLLATVNGILARWKQQGLVNATLSRWMPSGVGR